MIDGHVHLEKGPLSVEYAKEFIIQAYKMGLSELQILDHTHRFMEFKEIYDNLLFIKPQVDWLSNKFKDSLEDYLKLIEELKKIEWPIKVTYGLEVCYESKNEEKLRKILSNYHFDFLVGSVHSVFNTCYDCPWSKEYLWQKYDSDTIYQEYYREVKKLIESKLFSQLGHVDTIKMFDYYPSYDLTSTYLEVIELAKKNNVKIENNVGCYYRYNHQDLGLSDELLKLCVDNNAEIISASDAHSPNDCGRLILEVSKRIDDVRNN